MEIILGFEKLPVTFSTTFFSNIIQEWIMQINQKSAAAMCPLTVFPCKQLWKGSIPSFASDSTSSSALLWCILLRLLIICRTSSSFYYFELMQWMQVSKSQVSTSHKLACFNYTGTNNLIRLNTQCSSTLSAAVVREDVEGIVWAEAGHLKQVTSKYNPNSLTHCKTKTQPGCELETSRGLIQINRWDRLIWLTWNAS